MRAALDQMRDELDRLPQLYPSRKVLEMAYVALHSAELRLRNIESALETITRLGDTPRLDG